MKKRERIRDAPGHSLRYIYLFVNVGERPRARGPARVYVIHHCNIYESFVFIFHVPVGVLSAVDTVDVKMQPPINVLIGGSWSKVNIYELEMSGQTFPT